MTPPDPSPIIDLMQAFRRSKTMFTALAMGVFERLHEAPATAAPLAQVIGADGSAMERLLDACAALGLLEKHEGIYGNSPLAEAYLCTSSATYLGGYLRYSDLALYKIWGDLEGAIREGTHRWEHTFGLRGPIFDHFFRTPETMRGFILGMHGLGMSTSPRVVAAFDLSRFHTLADLGGATGHLTIAACERYPQLHGIVFDLPMVTAMAREQVSLSTARNRIEVVDGDFFADELPAADLFAVGQILHDWSEEKIARLLRRVAERLPTGGALLVVEKLLNDDGVGPVPANMQSLNMLLVTEGKERTFAEYETLLLAAGFSRVDCRRSGAYLDAILAVK